MIDRLPHRARLPRLAGLRSARLPLVLVAAFLGFLAVGQLRGQAGVPGLSDLSAQELGVLVANLNAQNDQLRAEVASLERQRADLASSKDRGQSAVDQLQSDLARIRAWAGLTRAIATGCPWRNGGPGGCRRAWRQCRGRDPACSDGPR